ncbi:SRPBCC family protein [Longispora urticae]
MDAIRHEVWINADRPTVFAALTTTAGLDAWWGRAVRADPTVGSVTEFDHGLGAPLRMRVTDLVPDQRLEWRCLSDFTEPGNPASEWLGHRLVFALTTVRRGDVGPLLAPLITGAQVTVLRFEHAGWTRAARWFPFCNTAWGHALGTDLRAYCETDAAPPS